MEDFGGHITHAGTDYEVNISSVYNEVLDEVNYAVSYAGASSFLLAWKIAKILALKFRVRHLMSRMR